MPGYDDIIQQMKDEQGATGTGPYEDAARELRDGLDQQHARATTIVGASTDANPDQAAGYAAMAKRYHTTPEVVSSFPDEFKQRMTVELTRQALASAPRLQRTINEQPGVAALIHDDIPTTAAIEQAAGEKGLGESFGGMPLEAAKGLGGSFSKAAGGVNLLLGAFPALYEKMTGRTDFSDWWFRNMVQPRLDAAPAYAPDSGARFPEKAANVAGNMLGVLSQISLGGTAGAAPEVSASTGAGQMLAGATEHGIKAMLVPAVSDALDIGRRVYQETGSGDAALRAAQAQYLTSSAGGVLPLSVPGSLLTRMGTGFGIGTLQGEVSRQYMNQNLPTEMRTPFDVDEMLLSGLANSVLAIGGPHGQRGMSPRELEAVRNSYREGAQATQAEHDLAGLTKLGELAAASKWRERDPEGFRQFVQRATEDGHLEHVYVEGRTFAQLLDKSGVPAEELMAKMPDVAAQMKEALQTDGYVRISAADYATNIAGSKMDTELLPHLKTDPEGKTYAEAQEFYQQQAERMKETAAQLVQERTERDTFRASQEAVQQRIHNELDTLGRMPSDVNKVYAAIHSAMLSRIGAALKITPEAALEKYGPAIAGERAGAKGFEQGIPQTAEAGELVDRGILKRVGDSDKGVKVYRAIGEGESTTGPREAGKWVTPNRDIALNVYARGDASRVVEDYIPSKDLYEVHPDGWVYAPKGTNVLKIQRTKDMTLGDLLKAQRKSSGWGRVFNQPVYHGSPHDFHKFSTKHIGTGEGAAAYGWGLYFAENKGIAESYRKALTRDQLLTVKAKGKVVAQGDQITDKGLAAIKLLEQGEKQAGQFKHNKAYYAKKLTADPEVQALIEEWKDAKITYERNPGSLYQVDIPDEHVANFLLWDKPLSEQPESVQTAIKGGADIKNMTGQEIAGPNAPDHLDPTGEEIYNSMSRRMGAEEASKYLNSLGIKGIKYLDAGSRTDTSEPTHNLVVFDDSIIKITHKDGTPVTEQERQEFLQGNQPSEARGTFSPSTNTIALLKDANLSTYLHETGHWALDTYAKIATSPDAPPEIRADMERVLEWFGIRGDEQVAGGGKAGELGQPASDYQGEHKPPRPEDGAPAHDLTGGGKVYPRDIYSSEGRRYYGTGEDRADAESFGVLMGLRGKPNGTLKVYRAVPFRESEKEELSRLENETARYLKRRILPKGMGGATGFEGEGTWYDQASARRDELRAKAEAGTLQEGERRVLNPGDWVSTSLTYAKDHGASALGDKYKIISKTVKAKEIFTNGDSINEWGYWPKGSDTELAQGGPEGTKGELPAGRTALDVWNAMSLDEQRPYHEQFARGMEAYLMEGKAPSRELIPAFQRIKSWMVSIYRTLRGLNVDLTPEVRGVFDRMLASEEAIREAEGARVFEPLFKEKPEGMSEKDWADYQALGQDATQEAIAGMERRSLRDMKWLSNAKSKAMKDLQRGAEAARKEVRAEVEKEVDQMPVYQLERHLKDNKISADKADMDMLADQFGFASGEAARKALAEREPRESVVQGLTDRRMLERYGELSSPEAIASTADALVHNDARARFVATGLKVLAKSPIPARELLRGAQEAAEAAVANKRVRDVNPRQYEAAETKANREAIRLAAKDTASAVQAQRASLLNNQLAKASRQALEDVQKTVDYFKRLEREPAQKGMRGEFLDQLNYLLARFDLRTSINPDTNRKALADWVAEKADELSAVMPDLPEWVANEGYRTSYKDLSVEQMRGLRDAVRQLEHLARREQKQYMAIRAMEFAEERGGVLDAIRSNWAKAFDAEGQPKGIEPDFVPGLKKTVGKLGDKFAGEFLNPETIISILEGGKFGAVHESLFGRLTARSDWKAERLTGIYKELRPLFKAYSAKEKFDFARKDISTEKGLDVALTRENALVVALLHGNAEGRERLRNYGWSEEKQRQIIGLLDGKDLDLAEAVWRLFDHDLWPELKALNDRTRGKAPPKVEAVPYNVNGRDLTGGYFRLKYDTALDERAHRLDEGQAVKELLGGGMGMSAKTNQGASTERKQNVSLRPRLDMGVFAEAVNETVHDLAYREAVADTMRMLNDRGVTNAIKQVVGVEGYRALVTRVREVAAPPRNPHGFVEKTISIARRNTIVNLMSGVKTALQNLTGLVPALTELNAGTLGAEVARFYSPKMMERYEFAMEQSAFMRNRFTHYERDLQNQVKKLTVNGSLRPDESTFLALMGFVDRGVSVPIWNAAFKQGMERFANDTGKAVEYADHIVRQTQGSGRDVDLALIMGGHGGWGQLKRAFTMFYSYFNSQLGLLVKHGVVSRLEAQENPQLAAAKFTAKVVAIVVVPAVLTELLMHGYQMDNESEDEQKRRWAGVLVRYGAGFMPFVRDIVPGIWAQLTGDQYFGAKVTPIDSAVEGVIRATKSAKDVATGEADEKDTKSLILGTGYLLGVPGKLIADTWAGFQSWLSGESGPQSVVLGPPPKRH